MIKRRNKSTVTISSIAQLDTDDTDDRTRPLFLFTLRLAKDSEGDTLSDFVDGILADLNKECRKKFKERLLDAWPTDFGFKRYREGDREKYKTKYRVYGDAQRGTFYRVIGKSFPRIRRADLKRMKVKVKTYDIDLDDCGDPADENQVAVLIKKGSRGT